MDQKELERIIYSEASKAEEGTAVLDDVTSLQSDDELTENSKPDYAEKFDAQFYIEEEPIEEVKNEEDMMDSKMLRRSVSMANRQDFNQLVSNESALEDTKEVMEE